MTKKWVEVVPGARGAFRGHAVGIELAFNTEIFSVMPAIRGWSPSVRVTTANLQESVGNVLAQPTDEEKRRWQGMGPEEKRADAERYVRRRATENGWEIREDR